MSNSLLSDQDLTRYNRHLVLPEIGIKGQEKLKGAKVLVIGAGGLGCPALQYLAAAGIGKIGIVDHDLVDISNLQRQILFTTADIGLPKVIVAQEHLEKLNPEIKISAYQTELTSENALDILKQYDIVVDCSDNFPTRYLINDSCVILDKTLVYGAIYKFEGQVAIFNSSTGKGRSGNYRDLYPTPPSQEIAPNCNDSGVVGVLPGIIGTLQANEVIKIICGIGNILINQLFIFDLLSMHTSTITFSASNKPISKLINYEKFCNIDNSIKNETMKEVTVQELKNMIDQNEDHQLIDVREQHEVEIAEMGGEVIPMGEVMDNVDKFNRDKKVIVHCRSGARSGNVIQALEQQHGFDNLYNLKGGILAWADEIDSTLTKY
jgi:adenylyltransferase/sulfurtransferase